MIALRVQRVDALAEAGDPSVPRLSTRANRGLGATRVGALQSRCQARPDGVRIAAGTLTAQKRYRLARSSSILSLCHGPAVVESPPDQTQDKKERRHQPAKHSASQLAQKREPFDRGCYIGRISEASSHILTKMPHFTTRLSTND